MEAVSVKSSVSQPRRVQCRGSDLVPPYNPIVPQNPLSTDTSPEIERLQIERWRLMSPAEKAAIVSGLTKTVYALALAGVRQRHPQALPREQFLRLAIVMLGLELARKVYPEIDVMVMR